MALELEPTDVWIAEPAPREIRYTVISVDDHVVEPPDTFAGRLPRALQGRAPRIVRTDDGDEAWEFDGTLITQIGLNAFAGRRPEHMTREPVRFDDMRPGCYDIEARIRDMDVNGVWASMNFPSSIAGFCGRALFGGADAELGTAAVRAWNDWLFEEWYSPYPDRIIPNGLAFLPDPEEAAREIVRNAERGFRAVSLPERPHRISLPPIFSDYWDPIMRACVDTGTVAALHVGSSGMLDAAPLAPSTELDATLFSAMSLWSCAEWLWSPYPRRYPELKIAMSEGGIGWVAMLIDRLRKIAPRYASVGWPAPPDEVLHRNFWFCTIDDYSAMATRHTIDVAKIMVEVDYPHIDGTWPDTQEALALLLDGVPAAEARAICCENAAALFRHPLPPSVVPR